jgi:hypothetical protein
LTNLVVCATFILTMGKAIDITHQRFGKLVAIKALPTPPGSRAGRVWECLCDCGRSRDVSVGHLRAGKITACHDCGRQQCLRHQQDYRERRMFADAGKRFGNLTVVGPARHGKDGRVVRECRCRCGAVTFVSTNALRDGSVSGCRKCHGRFRWARYWRKLRREERGKRYHNLVVRTVVAGPAPEKASAKRKPYAVCDCDCGTSRYRVLLSSLKTGNTKGCGCLAHVRDVPDMTGQVFGRLTVLRRAPNNSAGDAHWVCSCSCGSPEIVVAAATLRRGDQVGCGCVAADLASYRAGKYSASYRPDIPEEERLPRRMLEGVWNHRASVYARDKGVCQSCGEKKPDRVVHHVRPWSVSKFHRLVKWTAITLCRDCHMEFHGEHGYHGNTAPLFFPWLRRKRQETGYKNAKFSA